MKSSKQLFIVQLFIVLFSLTLTLILTILVNNKVNFNSCFIDSSIEQQELLLNNLDAEQHVFNLFSHGRSGELLINGEWKNAKQIAAFLKSTFNIQNSTFLDLNIYGCEFAKGEKGKQAVAYLENALGLQINASTNITGVDGDWLLEVGNVKISNVNYFYNLQIANSGLNDDYDGDGVLNKDDLDDDNDGITDADEGYSCTISQAGPYTDFTGGSWTASPDGEPYGAENLGNNRTNIFSLIDDGSQTYSVIVSGANPGQVNTLKFKVFSSKHQNADHQTAVITISDGGGSYTYVSSSSTISPSSVLLDAPTVSFTPSTSNFAVAITWSAPDNGWVAKDIRFEDFELNDSTTVETCTDVDTDQDGLPDYLDLDSDSDGCPDAIEGAGTYDSINLVDSTMPGGSTNIIQNLGVASNTDGTPNLDNDTATSESQGTGNAHAFGSVTECCSDASNYPAITDSDDDGYGDACDLDDDNDGILDADECVVVSDNDIRYFLYQNVGGSHQANVVNSAYISSTQPWVGGVGLDTTTTNYIQVRNVSAGTLSEAVINNEYIEYEFTTASLYNYFTEWSVYTSTEDLNTYTWSLVISDDNFATSTTILRDENYQANIGVDQADLSMNYLAEPNTTYKMRAYFYNVTGGDAATFSHDDMSIYGYTLCDTDNDGIPNTLDLDSDGDGCPDAIEGGSTTITSADLEISSMDGGNSGANYYGLTTESVQLNLKTPVGSTATTLGVPTSAGTGQTVGGSQTGSTDTECCLDATNYPAITDSDSDGDGVGDACDLDDDNDGILDTDECVVVSDNDIRYFLYQNVGGSHQANVVNSTYISSTQPWVGGVGLETTTTNYIQVSNVSAGTLSEAVINNEYIEYEFTTTSLYNYFTEWSVYTSTENSNTYTWSLVISDDNFATSATILRDENYQANIGVDQADLSMNYLAEPNTTYKMRAYFYNVTGGDAATFSHDDMSIYGYTLCDTDNDGIPNTLDLDSDGDGCPDAIEGAGSFTAEDLSTSTMPGGNTAGDPAYTGGNDPVQDNLTGSPVATGAVGSTGIPTVADQTNGQGVGASQTIGTIEVTTQPENEGICENEILGTVTFNASAAGTPADGLSWQWEMMTQGDTDFSLVTGGSGTGTDASLIVNVNDANQNNTIYRVSYTSDAMGCSVYSEEAYLIIHTLPVVDIIERGFCLQDNPGQILASPAGGTFGGGTYISSTGVFDPQAAGIGSHTITYDYTDVNGCVVDQVTTTITVSNNPEVTVVSNPTCFNSGMQTLQASPAGGVFSGPGVNATTGVFDPQVAGIGSHTVYYSVQDSSGSGCSGSNTLNLVVKGEPAIQIPEYGPYCLNDASVQLAATPSGGTYTGTGVNASGVFNPATAGVGTHTITYTIEESTATCGGAKTTTIEVLNSSQLVATPLTQTICSGATANIAITGDNGETVNWTTDTGLSGTGTSISEVLVNNGTVNKTTVFTINTKTGDCLDTTEATVTVKPYPAVLAPQKAVICDFQTLDISLASPLSGTVINWVLKDSLGAVVASGTGTDTATINQSGLASGSYNLEYTGTNNNCTSEPYTLPVIVS